MFQAEGTISQCKVTWAGKKEKEISRSRTVSTGEGARVGGRAGSREQPGRRAGCGFHFSRSLGSIENGAVTGPADVF